MSDQDSLNVWHESHLVGELKRAATGAISFRYASSWLASGGFAISFSLPLQHEDFPAEDGIAHRFFANLLPEGMAREHIVRDLKLPNTDFNLLLAIGGECAGALSILPKNEMPSTERTYQPITERDLARLVTRRGQIVAAVSNEERPRLSLAGAQDKCPVLLEDGRYFLPKGSSPTSHILKFEFADYRNVSAYEVFTTRLARAVGLPTTDITLCSIQSHFFTQVARYDRLVREPTGLLRLHQEDLCQALGYGHDAKYQDHAGPAFSECYRLVQDVSSEPAIDGQNLLRWQIFNVLAGNSDGHAKNLSLLHLENDTIRLAPFYDLVCTRAIERIDQNLAFAVGGERNPSLIRPANWNQFAADCDVRPRFVVDMVKSTASALLACIERERKQFEMDYGPYSALERIEQVVTTQSRRILRQFV